MITDSQFRFYNNTISYHIDYTWGGGMCGQGGKKLFMNSILFSLNDSLMKKTLRLDLSSVTGDHGPR